MKRKLFILSLLAAGLVAALSVTYARIPAAPFDQSESDNMTGMSNRSPWATAPSILAILSSHREFSDFERAVEASGLSKTLDAKGPFTVFVPTDEAFNRLPTAQEEEILKNPEASKAVVLNGMTSGYLVYGASGPNSANMDLARVGFILTQDGNRIPVIVNKSEVKVGHARLVKANIKASNGIIHVVDEVILPEPGQR